MKTLQSFVLLLLIIIGGCSGKDDPTPEPPTAGKIPITLNCGVGSRATETAFEEKDQIGVYVVNYTESGEGVLQNSDNYVDNMRFTYDKDGKWNPDAMTYWKDETTKADFYVYYPYATPANVTEHTFAVKEDQSTEAAHKASDFLWGKASGISPTEQAVTIQTGHIFSCAVIKVAAGNGFTEETLKAAQVSVKMNHVKTDATINLTNGISSAIGTVKSIVPFKTNDEYRVLLVPQTISADNFITVTVDDRDYNLAKDFTFAKGKQYTFTVTAKRTSNGVNVNINPWDSNEEDYGGVAE